MRTCSILGGSVSQTEFGAGFFGGGILLTGYAEGIKGSTGEFHDVLFKGLKGSWGSAFDMTRNMYDLDCPLIAHFYGCRFIENLAVTVVASAVATRVAWYAVSCIIYRAPRRCMTRYG